MELVPHVTPFTKPDRLKEAFEKHLCEFGRNAFEGDLLHAELLWEVRQGDDAFGFIWTQQHKDDDGDFVYVSMLIYPEHRGRGVGTSALNAAEAQLRNGGVQVLRGQVNNNRPETGRRTRALLIRQGYEPVIDEFIRTHVRNPDDREAILRCPMPLNFQKQLVAPA